MVHQYALMKNRDFRILTVTDIFTKFADSMDNVIVTLLVIHLTGSSLNAGILLAVTTIPGILFSLVGGTLSDIKSKKKILSLMTGLQSLLLLILALLMRTGHLSFAVLCVFLFVLESFSRLYSPAFTSAMVNIVSKQKYKQAVSLLATVGSMVQMVGNALAAVFVSLIGYMPTLLINSASYFVSAIFSSKLNIKSIDDDSRRIRIADVLQEAKLGLEYAMRQGRIKHIIALVALLNFILAWFDVALPFLLTESLKVPFEFLGYVKAASTLMFVLAGFMMSQKKVKNTDKVIAASLSVLGISVITMSFAKVMLLSVFLWGAAAFFRTVASLLLMSELAVASDEKMIGRVMGFFMLITSVSMFLSRLLSGVLVDCLGASMTFLLAGSVFLALGMISFNRKLGQFSE